MVVIGNEVPLSESRLAFSVGLSRSVKLGSLETKLDLHFDKNRDIPGIFIRFIPEFLKGKRLQISRSAILRNLGELFSLRSRDVNFLTRQIFYDIIVWELQNGISIFIQINPFGVNHRLRSLISSLFPSSSTSIGPTV
jgi:hypothetical protein